MCEHLLHSKPLQSTLQVQLTTFCDQEIKCNFTDWKTKAQTGKLNAEVTLGLNYRAFITPQDCNRGFNEVVTPNAKGVF